MTFTEEGEKKRVLSSNLLVRKVSKEMVVHPSLLQTEVGMVQPERGPFRERKLGEPHMMTLLPF